jgi:D-alanyl-D-alanine carboxypeptidase
LFVIGASSTIYGQEAKPDTERSAGQSSTQPPGAGSAQRLIRGQGPGGLPEPFPEAKQIAQPKDDNELALAIKKLGDELAASGKFSGSVLVAVDGKTLIDDAWGDADRKHKVANKPETSYDVGSIGKLFTQIAILQLFEAGKLKLDDPFGKYLTNYPNEDIAAKVTIRQVLLHSGGITDVFDRITPDINLKSMRELKDFLPLFAQKPLEYVPGSANRYSSAGYIVLGLIIEAVSGENYYTYVKEKILDPARMTHSGFFDRGHLPPTVARSYDEGRDVTDMHAARGSSAGGLQASAGDLLRLVQAINAGRLISKESVKVLRGLIPTPPNAAPAADESKLVAYGIGGGAPGVSALLSIDPTGHYTRVVLCNGSPPMAMAMGAAIREWLQHLPK